MIVSSRKQAEIKEFERLLSRARRVLATDAKERSDYYLTRTGTKFEKDVFGSLISASQHTQFEDTIELVSGRSFPDIVAKGYFGVEVKTSSKGSPWKCVGNSILETSRVDTIEKIYMFFGKIMPPPEFKFRPYQDCLYEVAVTHSPRYMVDFETPAGETIFDKMSISYDELRSQKQPIKRVLSYYRERYGKNCDLWWLPAEEEGSTSHLVIRFWNGLNRQEKASLACQMLALFPEIAREGEGGDNKYNRAAGWLIKSHNIICPSFRDIFTGGKLGNLVINDVKYHKVPPFFRRQLQGKVKNILQCLRDFPEHEIEFYWDKPYNVKERESIWIDKILNYGREWLNTKGSNLAIETFIEAELNEES